MKTCAFSIFPVAYTINCIFCFVQFCACVVTFVVLSHLNVELDTVLRC